MEDVQTGSAVQDVWRWILGQRAKLVGVQTLPSLTDEIVLTSASIFSLVRLLDSLRFYGKNATQSSSLVSRSTLTRVKLHVFCLAEALHEDLLDF